MASNQIKYRKDIQGLRAIAVALVLFSHLPAWGKIPGGFIGVDMFFVISGFVISGLLLPKPIEYNKSFFSEYFQFLIRRIGRLLPVLSVVIVVVVLLAIVFAHPTHLGFISQTGLWSEFFLSNFYFLKEYDSYWNPGLQVNPLLHTWSLGVEFQTYAFMPLLFSLILLLNWRFRQKIMVGITVAACLSFFCFLFLVYFRETPIRGLDPLGMAFYLPISRFWEFGFGIIAWLIASKKEMNTKESKILLYAGIFALFIGFIWSNQAPELSVWIFTVCLGTAMMILGGKNAERSIPARLMSSNFAVWLGDRSYSLYLWHWPILILGIWLFPGNGFVPFFGLAISMFLAMVTYKYVEQKTSFKSRLKLTQNIRPVLISVVSAIAVVIISSTLTTAKWFIQPKDISVPFSTSTSVTSEQMLEIMSQCTGTETGFSCNFYEENRPIVAVIGDSLGYRAFPAVALSAKLNGYNAVQMWNGGCSIALDTCPEKFYQYLESHDIAGIFIATNFEKESTVINGGQLASGLVPDCPLDTHTADCKLHQTKVAEFEKQAILGLEKLTKYTPYILVSLPFPQQPVLLDNCLQPPLFKRGEPIRADCGKPSLGWEAERQGLYPLAISHAVSKFDSVSLWNPEKYLCTDEVCPAVINDGEQIMGDAVHWTWEASRFIYEPINQFVASISP